MFKHRTVRIGLLAVTVTALLLANTLLASANPLTITLTVDPVNSFNRIGEVTLSGTVTCDVPANYANIYGEVTQLSGRAEMGGNFSVPSACGPTPTRWVATLRAADGIFTGGNAKVQASASACSYYGYFQDCGQTSLPLTAIRLRGGR